MGLGAKYDVHGHMVDGHRKVCSGLPISVN